MKKLVLIDGNSILNRAFYGIMNNKMLMTSDGRYTNAVYGFLNIMFKIEEDIKPDYIGVAFDLKSPTKRHELYSEYKGTRKGMPDELAQQLPLIKEVLQAMNIAIIEKEKYEADDILGTLAKKGEKEKLDVTILTGDRDSFQLASDNITIRIPRTKMGKTEVEDFNKEKIIEVYGVNPNQLIDVKGLQGDTSDNIPGVPGVGEKTALNLIKKYKNIENLYKKIEEGNTDLKGTLLEKLSTNKELAELSKTLGTIDVKVPLDIDIDDLQIKTWNDEKVLEIFQELRFNRFIERFNLGQKNNKIKENLKIEIEEINAREEIEKLIEEIKRNKILFYFFETKENKNDELIIKKEITNINVYLNEKIYHIKNGAIELKKIFESDEILKCSYKLKEHYILLKQIGINPQNLMFDVEIAGYILNSTSNYSIENLALDYLKIDINDYIDSKNEENQINLFENKLDQDLKIKNGIYAICINKLYKKVKEQLEVTNQLELFEKIEMPLSEVLADMQYTGIYIDKNELLEYGKTLQKRIEEITSKIYEIAGEEFNINSPKQLGELLFEKLKLPVYKKTKNGYSTDVDVLEKLKKEHEIIEPILEYRALSKLNSTYAQGLIPYINKKTGRIHSYFHQTVTSTGRISSTEPNIQNIPTRMDIGKKLREVFKPNEKSIFVDADYSQIELRVLAHISGDKNMIEAFNNNEDIHKQAASKVFNIPIEDVSKELRSKAKAVNFGIVYGISDFGLAEQIGVSKKEAKLYIEQYLQKYNGIKDFMDEIVESAKENGYVDTLFNRRRYIPEIKSNNYTVRQFGARVAMNTPIQGTAADIMKIAMINVYKELKERNLKSKIIVQVHDELLIETEKNEEDIVKEILKSCMENVIKLKVPLVVDISEGDNWYSAKND